MKLYDMKKEEAQEVIFSSKSMEKAKHIHRSGHRLLYWMGLLLLSIGCFFASMVLVPVMLFFGETTTIIAAALSGTFFGLIIRHIVIDLEHLEEKHHIFLGIFIPILSAISVFFMINVSEKAALSLNINLSENPYMISLVYMIAILLPYLIAKLQQHKLYKRNF